MNSDLFNDVETLKKQVTTLSTYLETEHREDISQNRQDISDNLSKINDTAPRRAVLAAHFSPRWCRWFLSALSPCADSTKDASGRRCADVFTANGCGQQGAGAARAPLPRRAVRALVPLVERTLALRQATMTHCGVSVSRPGPSSWGEKGHDDSTGTLHPAFMAPGKVGVRCLANVCGCRRTGI
jgi:hypothetical protein